MLIKLLKGFRLFLIMLVSSILCDMFILHGKIKLFIIAVANTTEISPFSTDGQSNWILILVIIIVLLLISILTQLYNEDSDKEKKDKVEKGGK